MAEDPFQRLLNHLRSQREEPPSNEVSKFKWMIEQQQPNPDNIMLFNSILSTGFPGQIIIIGEGDFNDCFLFDYKTKSSDKYKHIGSSPFLRRDYEISRKILQIPSWTLLHYDISPAIIHKFIAYDLEEFSSIYIVNYNMLDKTIEWKKIGCDEYVYSQLITKNLAIWNVYGLETDALIVGEKNDKLIIFRECDIDKKPDETFVVIADIDYKLCMNRIKNVFKYIGKIENVILIPITVHWKTVQNTFLCLTTNTLDEIRCYVVSFDEKKYEEVLQDEEDTYFDIDLNIDNDKAKLIEFDQVESTLLGRLAKNDGALFKADWVNFNDYLLLFIGDDTLISHGDLRNECHIFSYHYMQWIGYFKFPFLFNHASVTLNCGVIHFLLYWEQTVKHCTLDIGNMFIYRQQIYQSICDGMNAMNDECLKWVHFINRDIFDYIDDIEAVCYLEKPYHKELSVANLRFNQWIALQSMIDRNRDLEYLKHTISGRHSLNFMKLMFNYIEYNRDLTMNLPKPWNNAYQVLNEGNFCMIHQNMENDNF